MSKLINFGAGPAALPEEVLNEAAIAVKDYKGSGLSILEIPHRGHLFLDLLTEANALVLELLQLNEEYKVIWMQGGGRLQFCMLPLNFLKSIAGYIDSGHWAAEAMAQANLYGNTKIIASSKDKNYKFIPPVTAIPEAYDYIHFTTNNTIFGTQLQEIPQATAPLIADMSSEILSRAFDYSKFKLIYAVAQKNLGAAGVTLAVVHQSLLATEVRPLPDILSYQAMARQNSLVNTPPVFGIYTSLLMLRWIKTKGLNKSFDQNKEKAKLLYQSIDNHPKFYGVADPGSRSSMNVCFRLEAEEDNKRFLDFCLNRNITGIKGHRSVGGFRASIYNAISPEDVN